MSGTALPKVVVTRRPPEPGLSLLEGRCELLAVPKDTSPSRAELLEWVQGAQGIYALLTERIDEEVLEAAGPQLRVVSNMAVGVDNVDVKAATRRGIPVGHTPGVLTDATADLASALILAATRRLPEGARYVREGRWRTWEPNALLGMELRGATLGIVGMGRIGQAVAHRALGFGMDLLYAAPRAEDGLLGGKKVSLDELLQRSDVVSLHAPLREDTVRLIDARALARMKPGSLLVNTARGPLVDTTALVEALQKGPLGGAALDVTDPEPLPADHPLLRLDNCLVVPHVGSATVKTRAKMATLAAENLLLGLEGRRLRHCVNPEAQRGSE